MGAIGVRHAVTEELTFRLEPAVPREVGQRDHELAANVGAHDTAVPYVEHFDRKIVTSFDDTKYPRLQVERRPVRRCPGHHRGARSVRPKTLADAAGHTMHDTDFSVIHANRIGTDLGQDGFDALAQRGRPGNQLHVTGFQQGCARKVRRSKPALFEEQCEPHSDTLAVRSPLRQLALQRFPPEGVLCFPQQPGVIAGVEHEVRLEHLDRSGERHFVRADEISPPNLATIDLQTSSDRIEDALDHERRLEAARALDTSRPASCW
jgi:hypothetical protein